MAFQRAQWHSGLTYENTCEVCRTVVRYKDNELGFRPWFADGFVYCPKCKHPLRHSERFAIDGPEAQYEQQPIETVRAVNDEPVATSDAPAFCTRCGKQFKDGDRFCAGCGNKRQ